MVVWVGLEARRKGARNYRQKDFFVDRKASSDSFLHSVSRRFLMIAIAFFG